MRIKAGYGAGRWLTALVLLVSLPLTATPAVAAAHKQATKVAVHVDPATVHLGSPLVVSGTVSPHVSQLAVVLQRFVGKSWHTIAKRQPTATGAFTFALKAPAAAAKWTLRVTRTAKGTTKAGVSATAHVQVTKAIFVVKAAAVSPVAPGAPIVVTGSVHPKATGSVVLQRLVGRTWTNIATARLSKGAFQFSTVRPAGSYRLRVAKAFSTTVAGGVSPGLSVVVPAPVVTPMSPSVTTTTLPTATGGVPYSTTLTATGGTPPYLWAAAGLQVGMALSSDGVLSGTPTKLGVSTITVAVIDSANRAGSAALTFTVVPSAAGQAVGWGDGTLGQLGNNSLTASDTPVAVSGMTSGKQVASGGNSGYALKSDGTVWAWGYNASGQLGNSSLIDSSVPVQVTGLTGVTRIAGGGNSGYALKSDGTVWAWGYNVQGQLGNNSTNDSSVPVQVNGLTGVTAIAGGEASAYALTSDGTVWAWGYDMQGQLGNNSTANSDVPVQVVGLTGVTAIAAGRRFADALKSDGTVWAWGNNLYGQLGLGSASTGSDVPAKILGLSAVTAIADGGLSGYALGSDSYVRSWGLNNYGQLGDGTKIERDTPVEIPGLAGVTAISAGEIDGYALGSNGTVWASGYNGDGELGNGTNADSSVPVQVSGLTGIIAISTGSTTASGYAIKPG